MSDITGVDSMYLTGVDAVYLSSQLAAKDREIAELRENLNEWGRVGNEIMKCATGRDAPLSDSDVIAVIEELRGIAERARDREGMAKELWLFDAPRAASGAWYTFPPRLKSPHLAMADHLIAYLDGKP